jgi:acylphosphatase
MALTLWNCGGAVSRHALMLLGASSTDILIRQVAHSIQARRFIVRGRVQGVGFRWFVEREAHLLGIAGWVRNNPDSSVEVLAMGTRDQLAGLRSRLREGPRAARVDDVEELEAKPLPGFTTFRIEGAW